MKNTKTFQNLMNAFAGESQAFQRYAMYSKIAKKEGWANIAAIFDETALNEQQHAKEYFKKMCELVGEDNMPEMMEVNASYPIAKNDTYKNLMNAADGEHEETIDYAKFAEEAKEDGQMEISLLFNLISKIEDRHSKRYAKLAKLLETDTLLKKEEQAEWKCMKCGHVHSGKLAPGFCPVCGHDHGYFEKYELNI